MEEPDHPPVTAPHRRSVGAGVLFTAPWRRAPLRLFGALGLFAGVFVAAALMTTVTSSRPLLPVSLGTAVLRDDLKACPASVGLLVKRVVGPNGNGVAANGLPAVGAAGVDRVVAGAVADVPGLRPALVTWQAGETALSAGARTSSAQLVFRTDVAAHLAIEERVDGDGVLLGRRVADELGVRAGDPIAVTATTSTGAVTVPLRVAAIFTDPTGAADAWWCTLRTAIVGSLTGGALPFVFADAATVARIGAATERSTVDASWEVDPEPAGWTLPRARRIVPLLQARARAMAASFTVRGIQDGGTAAVDGTDTLGRAEQAAVTASATVDPVALGSLGLAVLLLADAARTWGERRRQQLVVLKLRGVGHRYLALKGLLELLPPVVLGAAAGIGTGALFVRQVGPSATLSSDSVADAVRLAVVTTAVAVVVLYGVLFDVVHRVSAVASGGSRRPRGVEGLGEVVLLVLAAAAFYELRTRGSAIVGTGRATHVDSLVLLFPVLLVAGAGGLAARALLQRRFLRVSPRLGLSVWLAARRLAAQRRRTVLVVSTSAVAVGIVAFSSSLSTTLRTTARAKATLGLGADQVVPIDAGEPAATGLPARSTPVLRTTEATVLVQGHDPLDVLGVDPATFARGAYWDASFAPSLPALLRSLGPAGADGLVPVIAAGPGVPDRLVVELRSATDEREVVDLRVVARVRYFPGVNYGSTRSMVVMDADVLRRRALAAERQLWVAGADDPNLLTVVRVAGGEATVVRRATALVDAAIVPQLWALDFLEVLGIATGAMAACALALYFTALGSRRVVSDALVRQMGLSGRAARAASVIEVATMLVVAWVVGVGLSWQALRMIHTYLDVSPKVLPPPLLRVDTVAPLLALVAVAVVAVVTSLLLDRRARAADPDWVLRHAG